MTQQAPELGANLLRGAKAIAGFVYGDEKMARKIFHLVGNLSPADFQVGQHDMRAAIGAPPMDQGAGGTTFSKQSAARPKTE